MAKKKWIANATENKGALHRHLNIPEGEKIPEERLEEAMHSKNGKIRKEAQLAKTLKHYHPKAKKKSGAALLYGARE